MYPALPKDAAPDPTKTRPLFPDEDEPVLKYTAPLAPLDPALAERILTIPLVVAVPSPLTKLNKPPVLAELRPEKARI